MKPCQQCKFSPLCLPMGFMNAVRSVALNRAHEHFKGIVACGIADPRDQAIWNGLKKDYRDKMLDAMPTNCPEKVRRLGQGRYYDEAKRAWL